MKNKRWFVKTMILFCFLSLFLSFSACSSSYEHLIGEEAAVETVNNISNVSLTGQINFRTWLMNVTLSVSNAFKVPAILFIPLSIVVGIILLNVFKNTAGIKKTAILVFILGIPVILFLLGWGSAILYTILYQS